MIRRAERRWKNADTDGDGSLSEDEFRDFIHPEESQRAGGVAVIEAMDDTDKNGEVSLEEYMEHLNKVSDLVGLGQYLLELSVSPQV
ncbi:hypothetical protein JTE90_017007 [Oedothorax gibbosus]|uniref:EF-hand domain-containing protein n=1 Tax=Oedothorax gibbosus TaxID=931172 RepID=A0AAV6UCB2_9ARAC|nr:hypothetical protein JTE90_017007 [Oedothorax gibbosus]